MTVWVIVCDDHAGDCWAHGVYESKASAMRAYELLSGRTYFTVHINKMRVRKARRQK